MGASTDNTNDWHTHSQPLQTLAYPDNILTRSSLEWPGHGWHVMVPNCAHCADLRAHSLIEGCFEGPQSGVAWGPHGEMILEPSLPVFLHPQYDHIGFLGNYMTQLAFGKVA